MQDDSMRDWPEVRAWRKAKRAELIERRLALPATDGAEAAAVVANLRAAEVPELATGLIGFYWPFKREIDLRPFVRDCLKTGARAALPVVVEKGRPVEFWAWQPRMKMKPGIWNIPVPAERAPVQPDVLLVALVGFDEAGYRLGYGGGYYDRTLAALSPRPLTLGLGFELGRLPTIHPQPHDIPLDAIVTERGIAWHRSRGRPLSDTAEGYASPPCFLHELDCT
ncbi:5-formyltetrahydrofolate cyclo-ligase [Tistlia consotensis]|uniref:5-formyltetrahydrofolate cyclo-ligase n=1 Tax=Tistlia consotensis USBA 355 TaxID=560819 RepID=A0A1Y6BBX8_9PROT|nr:5-formyltetrahydrofolate cyclo-ligase [Tistlia consotensis]SMF02171.1 5-formyltetrahydrofolate cyclo-ligase [Tistlia consotensis USBA 355]SNS26395.1 5-formyltetrahydrofolate cyclo-ligase [Tistlia consotensis]